MRYIKKVTLENFQSHKYSVVNFDSQLNVIVGPSDSGKSAIIRGIKWVLYNEPSGDYFIREGEIYCSVTLEFNDGIKIKRYRSKSENSYYIFNQENQEMKFEGFGTKVPEEITDLIGIQKIHLDGNQTNSINLGEQLEGAFLISEKTGTRASAIGRLVGVNVIDDALRETLKDVRNISISERDLTNRVIEYEKELEEYAYLDNLNENLNKLKNIENKIIAKSNNLNKLKKLLFSIENTTKDRKKLESTLCNLAVVEDLQSIYKKIKELNLYYTIYNVKTNSLRELNEGINDSNRLINKLMVLEDVIDIYNRLPGIYLLKRSLVNLYDKTKNYTIEKKRMDAVSQSLANLDVVSDNIVALETGLTGLVNLNNIRYKFKVNTDSLKIGNKYIEKLQGVDRIQDLYLILQDKETRIKNLQSINIKYKENIKEINKQRKILNKIEEDKAEWVKRYNLILNEYEICPFCFSDIDENKIKNIVEYYD